MAAAVTPLDKQKSFNHRLLKNYSVVVVKCWVYDGKDDIISELSA